MIKIINKQKELWEKLANANSKYYVASFKGKNITEEEYSDSGWEDYKKYISRDELIKIEDNFLEIGCGTGRMTEWIAQIWPEVIAIDISGKMIEEGKARLKGINNIRWIENDGVTIPLPSNSIDFAFSYIVFQHFKTKEMIEANFKEVYRVLKQGGLFKVLVRSDKVDINKWWGGVDCDEKMALNVGFELIKKEKVKNYGLWLWLQK